jgi:hypothetical protein
LHVVIYGWLKARNANGDIAYHRWDAFDKRVPISPQSPRPVAIAVHTATATTR